MKISKSDEIDLWAEYVRGGNGEWRKYHSAYINSRFEMLNAMYRWIAKQPGGK